MCGSTTKTKPYLAASALLVAYEMSSVGRSNEVIVVVANPVATAEDRFAIAGKQSAKHAVKLRRPGDAGGRSEVVFVGCEKRSRFAYVAADALIDTVRVK